MKQQTKKILMVTHEYPPYPGGVGRYCASLAAAAVRLGHSVTVLAPTHGARSFSDDNDDLKVHRFEGSVFHFRDLKSFTAQVRDILANGSFDEIHAADWPALISVGKIQPKLRCIGTLHGTDILLIKNSIRARLALASRALRHFQNLYCNSEFTRSLLQKNFPALAQKASVTFLGVDAQWFAPAQTQSIADLRKRIDFNVGDRIILTVARLDGRKGQLTTIEALADLPADIRVTVCYVCVGKEVEEGYSARLKAAAAKAGIRLVLTGRIPDEELHAAYATADVFALTGIEQPKTVEGFGLVLLEAAAQGLPAVVTNVQAIPEVVVQGKTGWIAPTTQDLTACFTQALSAGRETLRTECISHARQYTWDRCAAQTYGTPAA